MDVSTVERSESGVSEELITMLIDQHRSEVLPRLQRLWDYYRNELDFTSGDNVRSYESSQERGLPRRLRRHGVVIGDGGGARGDREVVIENDIAWRIHTLVDFMFGQPISFQSLAEDREKGELIERVLTSVFDCNGGIGFFQDMALLGSIYGHVDLLLRVDRLPHFGGGDNSDGLARGESREERVPSNRFDEERVLRYVRGIVLETVEAPRSIPVLNPSDYREFDKYVLSYTQQLNEVDRVSFLSRLVDRNGHQHGRQATVDVTEVWSDTSLRVYEDGELVREVANVAGMLPMVHIQNMSQPFFYEGLSEVEPLIPLQDELNTRLSDRANRITFQSFKMYLGKGIENFTERPVGPGQMWTTDNPDATIETFGGDGPSPSEESHISEIREAMDKASTVTPIAAGLLRGRVGNLTSEAALRVVLMGLISRTEKKRTTYGVGIERLCELILHVLDITGVLQTSVDERRLRIHWPSPLPENQKQRLSEAEMKLRIGIPHEQVLAELGYGVSNCVGDRIGDNVSINECEDL